MQFNSKVRDTKNIATDLKSIITKGLFRLLCIYCRIYENIQAGAGQLQACPCTIRAKNENPEMRITSAAHSGPSFILI